ncbi:MAG: sigma-70 family RNA polymerase sigma factor [Isosphaeraceae bacterium]
MEPPIGPDLANLLARWRAGDGSALGELLESHRHYLTLLVRLQVGSRLRVKVEVEDLVQEAFLEAHHAASRFEGETLATFLAWLRRIVVTVLANQVRHYHGTQRRDLRLERSLADDLDRSSRRIEGGLIAPGGTPSEEASKVERALWLAEAVEGLPEDYRTVILLRNFEDLSFPEVAQRMGRSLDSVKNLWVRALARLRRAAGTHP